MYEKLTAKEREQMLSLVSTEQRAFIEHEVKRSRRTLFEDAMRQEKISAIKSVDIDLDDDEKNVVDWMITDYIDFGLGNRDGKCACGIPLRFQFTVEHQKTGKMIQYGKVHLSAFLNIDVKDINGIINELDKIDHELDELLWKIKSDDYGYEYYEKILDKTVVPAIVLKHIEINVPLLDRQINRLGYYLHQQMLAFQEEEQKIQLEKRQLENERQLFREKKKIEYKENSLREKNEEDDELIIATKKMVGNGAKLEDIAYSLVLNGVNSAVEISWILVNNFKIGIPSSISTMERPSNYFDVLLSLRKHVDNGNLIMDGSSNHEDCLFYVNPHRVEREKDEIPQKVQHQLRLF